MKMNMNKVKNSVMSNPLVVIICLIIGLILVLAIFRPASNFLNVGFGVSAHLGDIRGALEFEAFSNNSNNQPSFVMYYAEWCGHCKRAKPEFQNLMDSYKGPIKIMMVDCEAPENANLVKSQNIKGFPTIRYYPSGLTESYQEYSGNRTYSDFSQYVNTVTGTLDKQPDNAAPV